MSACVKWAKEHVDDFNVILARQLSSVDQNSSLWKECMEQAHDHAAMLRDVGFDFTELIGKGVDVPQQQATIGLGVTT
jgi:hypothetical protein